MNIYGPLLTQEESASPAWLAAPAMNANDILNRKFIYGGLTLDVDGHYMGSVTATTHQEKGIITPLKTISHFLPFGALIVKWPIKIRNVPLK